MFAMPGYAAPMNGVVGSYFVETDEHDSASTINELAAIHEPITRTPIICQDFLLKVSANAIG